MVKNNEPQRATAQAVVCLGEAACGFIVAAFVYLALCKGCTQEGFLNGVRVKLCRLGMLKILVAHNAYQQRGGEDSVVEAEIALLRACGHAVHLYSRSNDDIAAMPKASAALQTLWSSQTSREVSELIQNFQPNVIHVHNTFPLMSPSLYWAASTVVSLGIQYKVHGVGGLQSWIDKVKR